MALASYEFLRSPTAVPAIQMGKRVCVCERAAEEIPVEASNSKVEQPVLINKYLFMKKQRENFYTVPHRCRHPCLFAARLVLHQRYNTVRKPYPRGM